MKPLHYSIKNQIMEPQRIIIIWLNADNNNNMIFREPKLKKALINHVLLFCFSFGIIFFAISNSKIKIINEALLVPLNV